MKKAKQKKPYYYEGELPGIGVKIVIQVFPDVGLVGTRLIKGNDEIILSTKDFKPGNCGLTFINRETNSFYYYDAVLTNSIVENKE